MRMTGFELWTSGLEATALPTELSPLPSHSYPLSFPLVLTTPLSTHQTSERFLRKFNISIYASFVPLRRHSVMIDAFSAYELNT